MTNAAQAGRKQDLAKRDWRAAAIAWLILIGFVAICYRGCVKGGGGQYGWDPSSGPYKVETDYGTTQEYKTVIPVSEAEYNEATRSN